LVRAACCRGSLRPSSGGVRCGESHTHRRCRPAATFTLTRTSFLALTALSPPSCNQVYHQARRLPLLLPSHHALTLAPHASRGQPWTTAPPGGSWATAQWGAPCAVRHAGRVPALTLWQSWLPTRRWRPLQGHQQQQQRLTTLWASPGPGMHLPPFQPQLHQKHSSAPTSHPSTRQWRPIAA
jgi:hypothetical protein